MERFFDLARPEAPGERGVLAGFVGKITGNSFMKREFGAPLVQRFLTSVDLQTVVDASGAYIPGHGTPTVLLFGRTQPPVADTLRVIDGLRGEPSRPADPAHGLVWSSVELLIDTPGTQNRFVRASDTARSELMVHPMTLGGGRELLRFVESDRRRLGSLVTSMGFTAISGEDEAFFISPSEAPSPLVRPLIGGDGVRDWEAQIEGSAVFPYSGLDLVALDAKTYRHLWPFRELLAIRQTFAQETYRVAGRAWWSWHQTTLERLVTPLTITWGEVATHNHFVLDRGGKVFKQTAPVIKLPAGATEEDHLALLGVLNSSTACFWLKQVCHNKGSTVDDRGARQRTAPFEDFFQYNATKVKGCPLPTGLPTALARELDRLATQRAGLLDDLAHPDGFPLADRLAGLHARDHELSTRMVALQEELDWQVLAAFDLVPQEAATDGLDVPPLTLGERAFEIVLARQATAGEVETTWFERHRSNPILELPTDWPDDYRDLVLRRIELIESDPNVGLIERPEHKRRWAREPWADRQRMALTVWVLDALEVADVWSAVTLRSTAQLADAVRRDPRLTEAVELLGVTRDADVAITVKQLVLDAAVPHPAALRLTEKGLQKRAVWERVWDLQRQEDRINARRDLPDDDPQHLSEEATEALKRREVGEIPVPPRYAKTDFRSAMAWSFRGKLDVPKERFVLVPGAEREGDSSPVLGWAGWDERDLARALAERIIALRENEAADAERLTPLLAGVLELLPWIHQWHPEADAAYGGAAGAFFDPWLDQYLSELGLTRDDLRAWRPAAPVRGRRRARIAA